MCGEATRKGYYDVSAVLQTDTLSLTLARSGAAIKPMDAAASKTLDERCGALREPIAYRNYDVTDPHWWGQNVLQLPKGAELRVGSRFAANFHACMYDGGWNYSEDLPMTCVVSAAP